MFGVAGNKKIMYLYRISYHKSHTYFRGTEVRSVSTSKYLMYMHVVASLDVQGIFMLYVMCVLSGVNCNAHIPRYKVLQPSG
jgi:hypothetical protein